MPNILDSLITKKFLCISLQLTVNSVGNDDVFWSAALSVNP